MVAVVPTEPRPVLVVLAAIADLVAGSIYGVLGALIFAIGSGIRDMPEGYTLSPAMQWLMAPTGAMLVVIGALLVFTGIQIFRGREWIRPVQWMLSIVLAILAVLGVIEGHDALCTVKLVCAVIPMVVLSLRHVRAWFDSPYVRVRRPRPPLVAPTLPSSMDPPQPPTP